MKNFIKWLFFKVYEKELVMIRKTIELNEECSPAYANGLRRALKHLDIDIDA